MTEIELNAQIAALPEPTCKNATSRHGLGMQYRRAKRASKKAQRLKIISFPGYAPHVGYLEWDYVGGVLMPVGKYIKYPKNSNCQRWMKHLTSKKARAHPYLPLKGNYYRRIFDYWWTLY